jgi:hypothetical protein
MATYKQKYWYRYTCHFEEDGESVVAFGTLQSIKKSLSPTDIVDATKDLQGFDSKYQKAVIVSIERLN